MDQDMNEHIIDPQGDLYLVVEHNIRLRVSTKILSMASKVLSAMFSPRYAQGQQSFTCAAPGQIELPDDNAHAMDILCTLLHFQPCQSEINGLEAEQILRVCVLADKYDCVTPLKYFLKCTHVGMNDNLEHMMMLFSAAYILEDELMFREVSRYLVSHFAHGKIQAPAMSQGILPVGIYDMLTVQYDISCATLFREGYELALRWIQNFSRWSSVVAEIWNNEMDPAELNQLTYKGPAKLALYLNSISGGKPCLETVSGQLESLQARAAVEPLTMTIVNTYTQLLYPGELEIFRKGFELFNKGLCLQCCRQGSLLKAAICDGTHKVD